MFFFSFVIFVNNMTAENRLIFFTFSQTFFFSRKFFFLLKIRKKNAISGEKFFTEQFVIE